MVAAIIVAAGASQRMGFDKLLAPLGEHCALYYSLRAFLRCEAIDHLIVVADAEKKSYIESWQLSDTLHFVTGGSERCLSVAHGLGALPEETQWVAVHDAARPLIHPDTIKRCLHLAQEHGAAACAHPVADTLKRASEENYLTHSVPRENLWAMETPQIFSRTLLARAYDKVLRENHTITDEVSAVQLLGEKVAFFSNDRPNFKITTTVDLELAQKFFK